MGDAATTKPMSAAAFLASEPEQATKHEYHRGEVFAMAGGSPRHDMLTASVRAELHGMMRGTPCVVVSSDQRISAQQGERYVYADVVVACQGVKVEPGTSDVLANPSVIVEVLSARPATYDRGEKWGRISAGPTSTRGLSS